MNDRWGFHYPPGCSGPPEGRYCSCGGPLDEDDKCRDSFCPDFGYDYEDIWCPECLGDGQEEGCEFCDDSGWYIDYVKWCEKNGKERDQPYFKE